MDYSNTKEMYTGRLLIINKSNPDYKIYEEDTNYSIFTKAGYEEKYELVHRSPIDDKRYKLEMGKCFYDNSLPLKADIVVEHLDIIPLSINSSKKEMEQYIYQKQKRKRKSFFR